MSIEETIRRRWEKFEPMRIRIMQEAYDCADRNEVESYNSIKVMCSEVLRLAEEMVLAERQAVLDTIDELMGMERERHPMFSEGYDHALLHLKEFVSARGKK